MENENNINNIEEENNIDNSNIEQEKYIKIQQR